MISAEHAWQELELPWQVCLSQAWEAYGAGSIPVGAALVDGDGELVAAARNRVYEVESVAGQLAHSQLAHAEINTLLALDPAGEYYDHLLYTSLEPCPMCVGAALRARIGGLRFATADPHAGGEERLVARNAGVGARQLTIEGPRSDAFGLFAAVLILVYYLQNRSTSDVLDTFALASPAATRAARELAQSPEIPALARDGAPLATVLHQFWDVLGVYGNEGRLWAAL